MCIRWGLMAGVWLLSVNLLGVNPLAADVSRLIPQLDDAEFSQRQAASQELMEAGKAVFPQLEKAALEGSREASGRAIDILKTHYMRGDDATKQAAQGALERLARSGNSGAAQRANDILNPPKVQEDPFNGRFGVAPGIIRGANIQIQVAAANAGNRHSFTRREANGKVEVEATEGAKKTKIVKQPDGSIEMEITEPVNGKETTKKYSAKNLDELKMKEPEAARIYERYSAGGAGNIPIPGFGQALPGIPGAPAAPNLPADLRERTIKNLDRQIEQLKGQGATNPSAQRIVELLQERKKELERQAAAETKPAEKPAEAPAEKPAAAPPPIEKPAAN
jgi:hypothetical protein